MRQLAWSILVPLVSGISLYDLELQGLSSRCVRAYSKGGRNIVEGNQECLGFAGRKTEFMILTGSENYSKGGKEANTWPSLSDVSPMLNDGTEISSNQRNPPYPEENDGSGSLILAHPRPIEDASHKNLPSYPADNLRGLVTTLSNHDHVSKAPLNTTKIPVTIPGANSYMATSSTLSKSIPLMTSTTAILPTLSKNSTATTAALRTSDPFTARTTSSGITPVSIHDSSSGRRPMTSLNTTSSKADHERNSHAVTKSLTSAISTPLGASTTAKLTIPLPKLAAIKTAPTSKSSITRITSHATQSSKSQSVKTKNPFGTSGNANDPIAPSSDAVTPHCLEVFVLMGSMSMTYFLLL